MKKSPLLFVLIVCIYLFINPFVSKANTVAAGGLYYEWISDSTYRFYVKIYRDCSTNPEPGTVPLCLYNPCNNAKSFSITLSKMGPAVGIGGTCIGYKNQCDSAASLLPGYQEVIYSNTTTLPSRCNAWRIFTHISSRNNSVNIVNNTSPFYAEATINNTASHINSSPVFGSKPIVYTGLGVYSIFSNIATDPDGDSLNFELIDPLTNTGSCSDVSPAKITYATATPPLRVPNNPFQTNQTASVSLKDGIMIFTPAQLGKQTAVFRIKEYRNRVLIASVTREIQAQVINATITVPVIGPTSITPVWGSQIQGCVGIPLSFTWDMKSTDKNAILVASDDHLTKIPGATITYLRQGSDSIRAVFNWTPAPGNTGFRSFIVMLTDSTCRFPGIKPQYGKKIDINISAPVEALKDTSICPGDTAQVGATGGEFNSWSLVSGTANSLSCTNCSFPKATPTVTSKYRVIPNIVYSVCPFNADTMTVSLLTPSTFPSISVAASPGTVIKPNTTVTFTATVTNCADPVLEWRRNNIRINNQTGTTFSTTALLPGDVIVCRLYCKDHCPSPRSSVSPPLTMTAATGVDALSKTTNIAIYPNPNTGSFTIAGKVQDNSCNMEVLNTLGQVLHKRTITVNNHEVNETLALDVASGVYLLKVNNDTYRFTVRDK